MNTLGDENQSRSTRRDRRTELARAASKTGAVGHLYAVTKPGRMGQVRLIFAPGLAALQAHLGHSDSTMRRHLRWLVEHQGWRWTERGRAIRLPMPRSGFVTLPESLMVELFGVPLRPERLRAGSSTPRVVESHAPTRSSSLDEGTPGGKSPNTFTEGKADLSGTSARVGSPLRADQDVLGFGAPLTDDEVRALGFEPSDKGWVPVDGASSISEKRPDEPGQG
jgi:hypothetical protein